MEGNQHSPLRYDKHKNTRTHTDGHTSRDEDGLLLASRKGAPAGTHAGGATRRDDVIRLPPEATVCALVTTGGMTDQPPIRREELWSSPGGRRGRGGEDEEEGLPPEKEGKRVQQRGETL